MPADIEVGGFVDDLATLNEMDEKRLLSELRTRYHNDIIYTNIGDILVAINPYKSIPIYGQQAIDYHIGLTQHSHVRPHIYAMADQVYQAVMRTGNNQCCLVSGESGAGKTESTKLLIRHIVHQMPLQSDNTLHEMIIQVNPLLEAFGNAETLVNHNSSRFGKFIQIDLDPSGAIVGAHIYQYLLEKSRVVRRGNHERNFHVFYHLFAGLNPPEMQRFLLDRPESYRILLPGQGGSVFRHDADLLHHRDSLIQLKNIIKLIGFASEEVDAIFGLLATILHVANIRFIPETDFDGVYIENEYELDIAASLLGVNVETLATVLISNVNVVRGEKIITMKSMDQAEDGRDALAKAVYSRLFAWIVRSINVTLDSRRSQILDPYSLRHVSVLDLAGFENFPTNSFEQLCINVANEQLQFYFNQAIFEWEIKSYEAEGIKHSKIKFTNNGPVLEMLLEQPIGLLSLLDEESRLARTTDTTLIDKFNKYLTKHDSYKKTKHKSLNFSVCHYAGEVRYCVDNFLVKNQDNLSLNMAELLSHSASWIVYELFTATIDDTGIVQFDQNAVKHNRPLVRACKPPDMAKYAQSMSRKAGKKLKQKIKNNRDSGERQNGNQVTVLSHFRNSLSQLMDKLEGAEPHFIRCIKPNNQKSASDFDENLVMAQLRYTGIVETTRIRRNGYPSRLPFSTFMERYKLLSPKSFLHLSLTAESCEVVLNHHSLKDWQIGKSRVFMKYWHTEQLNVALDRLKRTTLILQNVTRMFVHRRRMHRARAALAVQLKATYDLCIKVEMQMAKVRGMMGQQSAQDAVRHDDMIKEHARRMQEETRLRNQVRPPHVQVTRPQSTTLDSTSHTKNVDSFIGQRVIPKGVNSVHLRKVRENMAQLTEFSSLRQFEMSVITDLNSKRQSLDRLIWGKVIYLERNRQVAKFYLSRDEVLINGSNDAFDGDVIGLNRYSSHGMDDGTLAVRTRLQQGLKLKADTAGNIYCTRLGPCPVRVHDYANAGAHCFPADVLLTKGIMTNEEPMKIFDFNEFRSQIGLELRQTSGFDRARLDHLSLTCIVFDREVRQLLDAPCWLCVCNIRALNTLDNEDVLKEVQNKMVQMSLGNTVEQNLVNNQLKDSRQWSKLNPRSGIEHKEPPLRRSRIDLRNNNEKVIDHMPYSWRDAVKNDTVQHVANEHQEAEILSMLDQSYIRELVDSDDESKFSEPSRERIKWAKLQLFGNKEQTRHFYSKNSKVK